MWNAPNFAYPLKLMYSFLTVLETLQASKGTETHLCGCLCATHVLRCDFCTSIQMCKFFDASVTASRRMFKLYIDAGLRQFCTSMQVQLDAGVCCTITFHGLAGVASAILSSVSKYKRVEAPKNYVFCFLTVCAECILLQD